MRIIDETNWGRSSLAHNYAHTCTHATYTHPCPTLLVCFCVFSWTVYWNVISLCWDAGSMTNKESWLLTWSFEQPDSYLYQRMQIKLLWRKRKEERTILSRGSAKRGWDQRTGLKDHRGPWDLIALQRKLWSRPKEEEQLEDICDVDRSPGQVSEKEST